MRTDVKGRDARLVGFYLDAKQLVLRSGFADEIGWQESVRLSSIDGTDVRRELAWVVLSSGMRERVVRSVFDRISEIFCRWRDDDSILGNPSAFINAALRAFNHPRKIGAIVENIATFARMGLADFRTQLAAQGPPFLMCFSFIGPVTCWHLAKNLGVDVAKPDRHLVRLARATGSNDVTDLCSQISTFTGDRVAVIDLILWRYATIVSDYESRVQSLLAPVHIETAPHQST